MISIVTAIYNQKSMNEIYFECLRKYTRRKFELIIIDNGSTDGSADFFEQKGAVVIRNNGNYSYPYCQNRGAEVARYETIAFMNNDLIVSPGWDDRIMEVMEDDAHGVISIATNDRMESQAATKKQLRRWKRIKYPAVFLLGTSPLSLRLMLSLMYGNWETWTQKRKAQFHEKMLEGFSGSCIVMKRKALEKLGGWDERIQAADFDMYAKTKKRHMEIGDIKPIHLLLDIYFHHFQRLTRKSHHPEFVDKKNLITLTDKWGEEFESLMRDIDR